MIKRFNLLFIFLLSIILITSCKQPKPNDKNLDDNKGFVGTIYQIFVRSFSDSDKDGIGDFNGITQKLPYLKKLGVNALWLMPVHPSPTYHGYDVLDYYNVNCEYGTLDDFKNLIKKAADEGIVIFLDMVFNHSSNQHEWFKAALQSDEKYRSYYNFVPSSKPTGNKWHNYGNSKYYGYFSSSMPDFNFFNQNLQDEIFHIAEFWANLGVAGFRLDGALHFYGDNEYPGQAYDYYDNIIFTKKLNQRMRSINPNFYLLGEIWTDYKIYAEFMKNLSPVDFEISDILTTTASVSGNADYVRMINNRFNYYRTINSNFVSAPFLTNHDQDRIASVINDDVRKLRMASEMLLTLPGTPIIYYGEEIGMKGYKSNGPIWDETRRLPFPWGDQTTTTWFNSSINDGLKSAMEQESDPTSLLATYQRISKIRNENIALKYGNNITSYEHNNYRLQGYYREYTLEKVHQRLLIIHNFGNERIPMVEYSGKIIYVTNQEEPSTITEILPKTTVIIDLG